MDTVKLQEQAQQRQELFVGLYKKVFPAVAKYVARCGGSFDEAKDVFQDALLSYYEKTAQIGLSVNNSDGAYIYGTARYLWIKRYKEGGQTSQLNEALIVNTAEESISLPDDSKLLRFLESAGKRCMELLRSFYYDKLPMTQVAETFGFSGVRSATVQKYKCIEKVRETVKQKELTYEDFLK
ncbi:sigma-70 family RNA polymerase sigma factor [Mucilaginibacter sp. KACC 22773]|uniref:RNA polymerase sigma factor n=1 Tax=Mucilaginibacter sp. KACC 22773 TaxID=3025671 RepID=UPI00236685DC|nr:sigma-70 family RNA polymerase sigma factor [Mucilaginibacter sp. KACC 22773]WDF76295.1 sigma-70 family RNA polymerase sigma factor [Mucilaginibacter sp. KACC 22773]